MPNLAFRLVRSCASFALLQALSSSLGLTMSACSSEDGSSASDPGGGSLDDAPIEPRFQALATAFDEERVALGATGAAIAILERGEVTFAHGFGVKGPSSHEKARARTLFRIGSITKGFTAAAAMTLVDTGKLDLEAPITKVIPDLSINDPQISQVNLHLLMSHQAGLVDLSAYSGRSDDNGLSDYFTSPDFRDEAYFLAPPGTFYNYSNTNFDVTGLAVERASGAPFRLYMREHVFQPLGMSRTFFLPEDVVADGDYSTGMSSQEGAPGEIEPADVDVAWSRPDGGAFSSVLDLARWVKFLQVGTPEMMSDSSRNKLVTGHVYLGGAGHETSYGYGLLVATGLSTNGSDWRPTKVVMHDGRVPGFAGQIITLPETGFGIVILVNAEVEFSTTVALALTSFGGLPDSVAQPKDILPQPNRFPQYAGTYFDPHQVGEITVSVEGTTVGISIPALDSAAVTYDKTLIPIGNDSFFLNVAGSPTELSFVPDNKGSYVWLRTREVVAHRE
ncbi:MAG: serine hydrolase [Polyangiaceae bacterium]